MVGPHTAATRRRIPGVAPTAFTVAALGLAFPAFASTLDTALPAGTSLHVGVTSTEMGYSSSGNTTINNGDCTFLGDGDQPNDAFYITPDVTDTGRNGAQGH